LPDGRGIEPWDAEEMAVALVDLVRKLPRERLDCVQAPSAPGAYIQWLAVPSMVNVFGQLVATGQYPAYHGVAYSSLRERLGCCGAPNFPTVDHRNSPVVSRAVS